MDKQLLLLEKMYNGWHAVGNGVSVSFRSDDLNYCLERVDEGCVVIDKSELGDEAVDYVLNGPMVGVGLPPRTIDRFSGREDLSLMFPGLEGGFATLAAQKIRDREWRGLDFISLDLHVAAWRGLGARVGHVRGGQVEWEG